MPTEHRFPRIVDHVEPVVASNGVVFANTFIESDAARANRIRFVGSVLEHIKLKVERSVWCPQTIVIHLKSTQVNFSTHFKSGAVERRRRQIKRERLVPDMIGIRLFREVRFLLLDPLSVLNQIKLDEDLVKLQILGFHDDNCQTLSTGQEVEWDEQLGSIQMLSLHAYDVAPNLVGFCEVDVGNWNLQLTGNVARAFVGIEDLKKGIDMNHWLRMTNWLISPEESALSPTVGLSTRETWSAG